MSKHLNGCMCHRCSNHHHFPALPKAKSSFAAPDGSVRAEDLVMLIRRLCRVVARHDANNTVRDQALDYLHRHNLGGSPLKGKAPNAKLKDAASVASGEAGVTD